MISLSLPFMKIRRCLSSFFPLTIAIVSMLLVGLTIAFEAPTKHELEKAIGPTSSLSPALKRAFSADASFAPIPEPGTSDWLSTQEETGQTYAEFLQFGANRPGANGRTRIYIQPIGDFPKDSLSLDILKEYMEAFYYPMPVELAPNKFISDEDNIRSRNHMGASQLHAIDLLDYLERTLAKDAYIVMGVTMTDLYPDDSWNFIFGMARFKQRVGVFSFARYGDDPIVGLGRALKILSHETGHAFGIKHCTHYHCIMNGSNGMNETDRSPYHLCPVCLRKIHWGLKFDPVKRYMRIHDFFKKHQMSEPQQWYADRIKVVADKSLPARDSLDKSD
ncbi:archaemetzincin [Akkermansiaceae bacterium]|nr:archaemetzincin [Akkermansiaceae bacterium]